MALESGRTADPALPLGTRQFFTARSVMSFKGGRVFTADAGVMAGGEAAEQLHVVGGDGLYEGASGTIYVAGNEFTGASYRGTLCLAN